MDATYDYRDRKSYLSTNINRFTSNFKYYYLDTQAFDNPDAKIYTIGFYNLKRLKVNASYSTYIYTTPGKANDDLVVLTTQRLHIPWWRDPFCGCQEEKNPWCYFGKESEIIFDDWKRVPGTYDWVH